MARKTLYCPICGERIPRALSARHEIMCPNDKCAYVFTTEEAVTKKTKARAKKNPILKSYTDGYRRLHEERLAGLKSSWLKKFGYVFLLAAAIVYAALFEYALTARLGVVSVCDRIMPSGIDRLLAPYAQAVSSLLPQSFVIRFPLYNMLFSLNFYALAVVALGFFFTRYGVLFAIRLMRLLLLEATALYIYFIGLPMARNLGPDFICEDAIVFIFSHVWPTLITVVLLSLIKPLVGLLCRKSDDYAKQAKEKARV